MRVNVCTFWVSFSWVPKWEPLGAFTNRLPALYSLQGESPYSHPFLVGAFFIF